MPQASDRQHILMKKWFNNEIDENGPIEFLKSHGYILTGQWLWIKPVFSHTISNDEYECLQFLIDEWDFGGIQP